MFLAFLLSLCRGQNMCFRPAPIQFTTEAKKCFFGFSCYGIEELSDFAKEFVLTKISPFGFAIFDGYFDAFLL